MMTASANPPDSGTTDEVIHDFAARLQFNDIIARAKKPGGAATLTIEQRKFLLAALVGSVVPVDGKIKPCELETLRDILALRLNATGKTLEQAMDMASADLGAPEHFNLAANRLQDLLSIEDRCNIVGLLWEIALCDRELHAREEELIYRIADAAGVPRKRVAEMQARAAANIN
ncbi:MAG: TerB family tellurite resistance protein [Hyphomicrobiales bacterium]